MNDDEFSPEVLKLIAEMRAAKSDGMYIATCQLFFRQVMDEIVRELPNLTDEQKKRLFPEVFDHQIH